MITHVTDGWFTETPWTGNWIVKRFSLTINTALIPGFERPWVIKNYADYMVHFNTLRGKKGRHYASRKRLDIFKENLKKSFNNQDVDPIEYLISLYYQCWLSVDDMSERVGKLWFEYKDATWLRMFLTKTLNWTLRENTERTEHRVRKEKNIWKIKRSNSLREYNKPRIKEQVTAITHAIDAIMQDHNSLWNSYSVDAYNSLSNNTKKCLYLLQCFMWVWAEEIEKLFSVEDNQNIICSVIETKLAVIFASNNITPFPIYARTISEIRKMVKQ